MDILFSFLVPILILVVCWLSISKKNSKLVNFLLRLVIVVCIFALLFLLAGIWAISSLA